MIRIQKDDFDLKAEYEKLTSSDLEIGAVVTFTGLVRDFQKQGDDTEVHAITLEHYPGMTEKELEKIEQEAHERWDLNASLVIHRIGRMTPGDQIVLVITASAHRKDAFEAAEFLMDYLKTKAPFWKLEETDQGDRWVEARSSDDQASKRWQK